MALSPAETQKRYRDRQNTRQGALVAGLRHLARDLTSEGFPEIAARIERLLCEGNLTNGRNEPVAKVSEPKKDAKYRRPLK